MSPLPNMQHTDEHASSSAKRSLGQYRLIAQLGTGGMAEVFLAVAQGALDVNRLVVVKRLRGEQADEDLSRDMFLNEARLAARLAHPNVIQTFEAGIEAGSYFLAMEYIDGQPLSRVLTSLRRANRRMDPRIAARICADALQGLHYAHELKDFDGSPLEIVHRDVSPQNIMLTYDGVVKIVDFGIAKAAGSAQTELGVFKGKVGFMAPEQLVGGQVDRRVDVFAAGIVLWEAVTGKPLMAGDTPAKTLYNLMHKRIPRASEICSDVPEALDDVLAKALERDVDKRYASAREMRDALEGFITSSGGASAEQVGALVTSFFAETRASVQREVKAQLAALSLGRRSESSLAIHGSLAPSQPSGTHRAATLVDLSDATPLGTASTSAGVFRMVTGTGVQPMPGSRTKRIALTVWIVATLGAVGVSGLALSRSLRPPPAVTATSPAIAAPPMVTAISLVTTAPPPPVASPAPALSPEPTPTSHAATQTAAPVANTAPPAQVSRPVVVARPAVAAPGPSVASRAAATPRAQPSPPSGGNKMQHEDTIF